MEARAVRETLILVPWLTDAEEKIGLAAASRSPANADSGVCCYSSLMRGACSDTYSSLDDEALKQKQRQSLSMTSTTSRAPKRFGRSQPRSTQ